MKTPHVTCNIDYFMRTSEQVFLEKVRRVPPIPVSALMLFMRPPAVSVYL